MSQYLSATGKGRSRFDQQIRDTTRQQQVALVLDPHGTLYSELMRNLKRNQEGDHK